MGALAAEAHVIPTPESIALTTVVGVDGCRIGWVASVLDSSSNTCSLSVFTRFVDLLDAYDQAAVIAVDIPIGLSDSAPRDADVEARRFLGARGSSVFPAPCRAVLAAVDYQSACALSLAACGKKISKQTNAIRGKIREVDALLQANPSSRSQIAEVHPELSFALLNGGVPMAHPKKRSVGRAERLAVLPALCVNAFHAARSRWLQREVATDDMLDALVAMWSGERIARGVARSFPPSPVARDAVGLPMRIQA